ncbi:MAG: hypothetical protein EB084_16155 [Proteobacteria bacterium]|nr:hypothetical protein [Pseudomonadota bacterium]
MTTAPLTRERYALIGAILMGVKYNLDRLVAGVWNRPWSLETDLFPGAGRPLYAVLGNGADVGFYRTMLLMAHHPAAARRGARRRVGVSVLRPLREPAVLHAAVRRAIAIG